MTEGARLRRCFRVSGYGQKRDLVATHYVQFAYLPHHLLAKHQRLDCDDRQHFGQHFGPEIAVVAGLVALQPVLVSYLE